MLAYTSVVFVDANVHQCCVCRCEPTPVLGRGRGVRHLLVSPGSHVSQYSQASFVAMNSSCSTLVNLYI